MIYAEGLPLKLVLYLMVMILHIQQKQTNMLIKIKELQCQLISISQTPEILLSIKKNSFLHNTRDKIQLIKLISRKLHSNGILSIQAEGNANQMF